MHTFKRRISDALNDTTLQKALKRAKCGFVDKRQVAIEELPEFNLLRRDARRLKAHTLAYLDFYLTRFEQQVIAHGGQVHWADTAQTACNQIVDLCQQVNAQRIVKSKSMISEEINLNRALANFEVVETDLGEYIIQLAQESPSHIVAPAVHKSREAVAELFHMYHPHSQASTIAELVNEARQILRDKFLQAELGITGANFLVAETGTVILVTNEGNADLAHTLPPTHIVVTSIDKIVPTLEDATTFLRLLGRSATGQTMTTYTTLVTGARRQTEAEGPDNFHVVLVDNGRTRLIGTELQTILYCIRCGACLNHCPIYNAIGGHAYGWVYPGPMGAVLTPLLQNLTTTYALPEASTLCGRCEAVCPLEIPLPQLLRQLRVKVHQTKLTLRRTRWLLALWAFCVRHPRLYHLMNAWSINLLSLLGCRTLSILPILKIWSKSRDIPLPQGRTFMALYRLEEKSQRTI